jgi:hypothetical protein
MRTESIFLSSQVIRQSVWFGKKETNQPFNVLSPGQFSGLLSAWCASSPASVIPLRTNVDSLALVFIDFMDKR